MISFDTMQNRRIIVGSLLFLPLVLIFNYFIFNISTTDYIYSKPPLTQHVDYIFIMGAGKDYINGNRPNYSFLNRIQAVLELHNLHPQSKIIISGYSDGELYDESLDMSKELIRYGIDTKQIILDKNSKNTYESICFLKRNYSNKNIWIVSQKLHLIRALWLCNKFNLKTKGIVAKSDKEKYWDSLIYELFSTFKMRIEYLLN